MKQKNPYRLTRKPKLIISYCVYMDILGFSQLTQKAFNNNKENELFNKLYHSITEVSGLIKKTKDYIPFSSANSHSQLKIFTDNIVIGYPIFKPSDGEGEFGHLVMQLLYTQMSLALEGFFIRGGFTVGKLYIDEKIVFGDALLEAYRYESEIANNPRIVFSEEVMKIVRKHLTYYGRKEESPQNSDILIDVDNQPFVNYLVTTVSDEYYLFTEALLKHKEKIEEKLVEFNSEPKIWYKYFWLANYHNYFCNSVRDLDGYDRSLLINPKLAIQEPRRLVSTTKSKSRR